MSGYSVEAVFSTRRNLTQRKLIQDDYFVAERDAIAFAKKIVYFYRAESATVYGKYGERIEHFEGEGDRIETSTDEHLELARMHLDLAQKEREKNEKKVNEEFQNLREAMDEFVVDA